MLEKDVVAIIGPQSSTVAHMTSQLANGVQVPIISYAATDPTLSSLQFPYFFRTTQSDSYQMAAMANLIDFYGWKEVIAIYTDDEYGRNGVFCLDDEVEKRESKISYKLALPTNYNLNDLTDVLNKSIPYGPRVYIVHINPDPDLKIFEVARKLNMTTSDYVWLTTDWLCTTLASFSAQNQPSYKIIEGVVGLCQHTPKASQMKNFGPNVYGSYAFCSNIIEDTFQWCDGSDSFQCRSKLGSAWVFDGAVGDIAIVTNRTKIVDYTQPYATTGLVIVVPINNSKGSAWVFLRPFTIEMWCVTAAAFVLIAFVIWLLEHRVNDDFRGPLKRQLVTIFLFSFSTLFKRNQEDTVSPLGRMVMVVWLFLLMVITSSYTASLTSILTVEQLSSPITGMDSLAASHLPIGYQDGSFAGTYLAESLFVARSRLIPLGSADEYEKALRLGPHKGGVAAIVEELPYVELFLLDHTDFGIVGQPFTRSGWGFAFKRDSPLATTLSVAILQLSENGKLQEIHDRWFCKKGCSSAVGHDSEPNQLQMSSFWGLYISCGVFSLTALVLFLLQTIRQYIYYKHKQMREPSSPLFPASSSRGCYGVVFNFFDFIDEKEEAIKNMFKKDDHLEASQTV
nr:glutamate receptor 3.7 [Tanacetum cinerariifolium]